MQKSLIEVTEIDKYIERLKECKPLTEQEVKELCDKVLFKKIFFFLKPNLFFKNENVLLRLERF